MLDMTKVEDDTYTKHHLNDMYRDLYTGRHAPSQMSRGSLSGNSSNDKPSGEVPAHNIGRVSCATMAGNEASHS